MTIILTLKVKSRKDPNEDRRSESLPISILLMSNSPLGRVTGTVHFCRKICFDTCKDATNFDVMLFMVRAWTWE